MKPKTPKNNEESKLVGRRIAISMKSLYHPGAPPTPRRRMADGMESFQIMEELRSRNFVPSGFFEDDRNKLQEFFDQEFEIMVIAQEQFMSKVQAERNSKLESDRKNKLMMRRAVSQRLALQKTPTVVTWMEQVKDGTCRPMANWSSYKPPLIAYICEQLPVSSPLKSLELCNNSLTDDYAELLRDCLSPNQSLRRVNLAHNKLGPATCFALGEVLAVNQMLQSLSLEGNPLQCRKEGTKGLEKQFGIYGVQKLAGSLRVNTTLHNLNLLNTGITKEGRGILADVIPQNDGLLVFSLDSYDLTVQEQLSIRNKLQENDQRRTMIAAAERSRLRREKEAELEREAEEARLRAIEEEREFAEKNRAERVHQRWRKKREEKAEQEAKEEEARLEAQRQAEALRLAASKKGKKKKGKKKKGKKKEKMT